MPLSDGQLRAQLADYNQMDAEDVVAVTQDQQLYGRDKGTYWGQQFLKGFNAPYQSVAYLL